MDKVYKVLPGWIQVEARSIFRPMGLQPQFTMKVEIWPETIELFPDGSYTFTPETGFAGTVPVDYVVVDDNGHPATDNATLTIEVIPNPPADGSNNPPIAQDDTNTTEAGVAVTANVIIPNDSDIDGDPLTAIDSNIDTDGDGVPDTALTPGGSAVTVAGVDENGNPVTNAGTLSLNTDGTYVFTPNTDIDGNGTPFTGTVVANYTISDGNGGTDSAMLTIDVVDDAMNNTFANDDANSGLQGSPQTGNIQDNDNDPEGDLQTITSCSRYRWYLLDD